MTQIDTAFSLPIHWRPSGRAEFPYYAEVDGQSWEIRINDFPVEPMYTLLIDREAIMDFDDWPRPWQRP